MQKINIYVGHSLVGVSVFFLLALFACKWFWPHVIIPTHIQRTSTHNIKNSLLDSTLFAFLIESICASSCGEWERQANTHTGKIKNRNARKAIESKSEEGHAKILLLFGFFFWFARHRNLIYGRNHRNLFVFRYKVKYNVSDVDPVTHIRNIDNHQPTRLT